MYNIEEHSQHYSKSMFVDKIKILEDFICYVTK